MGSTPSSAGPTGGLSLADRNSRIVKVGERGFLLMPGAHPWPQVAAIVEEPWLPTQRALLHPCQPIITIILGFIF